MGIETLLIGGLVAGAVGSAVSSGVAIAGAVQQREEAHDTKKRARANAAQLHAQGMEEARLRRLEGRRLAARQRSLAGASGLTTDSFFDTFADSAAQEEFAAQRVQQAYDVEGGVEMQRGVLEARSMRQRSRSLLIGGGTEFIGGLGSAATSYAGYKAKGYVK